MAALIHARGHQLVRIHESGDFYDQEYLNKWFWIAETLPSVTFWVNSKMWGLDWSRKPPNINVRWSIWPDTTNPPASGTFAYAGNCGPKVFECPGKCDGCMHCPHSAEPVHYNIH